MLLNNSELIAQQKATGFRAEILEKVIMLIDLLNAIYRDKFLRSRFVLKGGTALNLFYLDLPRMSVDIDLNYIGSVDPTVMRSEREEIDRMMGRIFLEKSMEVVRKPSNHAGGKYVLKYPSALSYRGNLEFDINYMHRQLFQQAEIRNSINIAGFETVFPVLNFSEIVAGKLCALFARDASRDLFDVYQIVIQQGFDAKKMKTLFFIYGAMDSKKDWRTISLEDINANQIDLKNKLIPMLRRNEAKTLQSARDLAKIYVETCREKLSPFFPLSKNEIAFYDHLKKGEVKPELLSKDKDMIEKIKSHPAILFQAKKAQKNKKPGETNED